MPIIFDKVNVDNSKRVITDEGYLVVPAKIARDGFYSYYADELGLTDREPDSEVIIYRSKDEVFNPESMSSFAGKPVTNNHPPVLVDVSNIKQFQVGFSGESVKKTSDNCLETTLTITDQKMIQDIESGKVEISNGYTSDVEMKEGFIDGRKYDGIQRNIKGNHIAIVEAGRAGKNCRLSDNQTYKNKGDNDKMKKVIIDGVSYEMTEQGAEIVGKLQDSNTQLKDSITSKDSELKTIVDALKDEHKKELDKMQAKIDDAESRVVTDADLDKKVSERVALIDSARKICKNLDTTGKSNAEIVNAAVESKGVNVSDKSPDYIQARFDAFLDSTGISDGSQNLKIKVKDACEEMEDEDEENMTEEEKAKKKQMADSANRWKRKKGDK